MRLGLVLVAASASSFALADGLTSLNLIPIADILGDGEKSVYSTATYSPYLTDVRLGHGVTRTVGVGGRFEFGSSTDLVGTTYAYKYSLFDRPADRPYALVIGAHNVDGTTHSPFAAGRLDWGRLSFHAGWLRDDIDRGMGALTYDLDGEWLASVEHLSGPEGATWVGLFWSSDERTGFVANLALGFSNTPGTPLEHSATLAYRVRF